MKAWPAVELLWGHADSVKVRARNLEVSPAQTGKLLPNGTLSQVIDSPAIQITANVTGTRSINALNALVAPAPGAAACVLAAGRLIASGRDQPARALGCRLHAG